MGLPEIAREVESAADAAVGSGAPAQNNATELPNQRAGAPVTAAWLATVAPWHVQLMWLATGTTTVVYLQNRDWGMFEIIPWIIGLVVAMAGWFAWLIAWSVLTVGSIWSRLIYFVLGLAGVLAIVGSAVGWPGAPEQVALLVARVAVGWSVPMMLVRRRGWLLQRLPRQANSGPLKTSSFWQFSIGDLLVLTAGSVIYLGLMMAHQSRAWQEIVLECLLVVCSTGILVVGLSWRRYWLAAIASSLGTAAIFLITVAVVNPDVFTRPLELLFAPIMLGPAVILLLAAIAIVRWCGYRLSRETSAVVGG